MFCVSEEKGVAPFFIQELPDLIEVLPGSTVRIDCRIYGKPPDLPGKTW